jgi:ornithine carbamoyltransferase
VKMKYSPKLKNRSLLSINDLDDSEMMEIIELAIALKKRRSDGIRGNLLHRKNIALIFEKGSTRTRCSATIAARDEGGDVEYLTRADTHFGVKESVKDTARVLGRIFDGILFRGFSQETLRQLDLHSGVPVWNGLTDNFHPTQILADLMTMKEAFGTIKGKKVVYIGDGRNNVANSLMAGCAKAGVDFVNCTPEKLFPEKEMVQRAMAIADKNNSTVRITSNPDDAVVGANVIYTDVWFSMGEETRKAERVSLLKPFQVNMELMEKTGNIEGELIFLHCLPAFHDNNTEASHDTGALEVTNDVFEAPFSKVFDEAENRMHTIKALFVSALADAT